MPPLLLLRQRTHSVLRSALSHRVQLYSLLSLAAVSAVVFNALRSYSNFYSVTISLSKSSRSVLVRAPTAPRGPITHSSLGLGQLLRASCLVRSPHCATHLLWLSPRQRGRGMSPMSRCTLLLTASYSACMTDSGSSSPSPFWRSPYSGMNST
jgi:hypothetical protein